MCFSENMSLGIGLTGLLSSIYLYSKNKYASIGIGYFSLMEIIQFFQYKVIDQCNNNYNKFLTYIGYIHICFQPLFFNLWLFAFTKKPNFTFIYMSFFAALLLLSRIFNVKDDELCDNKNEPLCGKKTCAFSGNKHVAWNLRLRAPGKNWLTPSIGLHAFMWIVPVLTLAQIKPITAMLLTGPYLGYILTDNIHEQPAIWCYTAIAQLLLTFFLLSFK
tara:strand:+ start:395 stop:1048 length:654 start_codon:yes stop_codon:yes gene_type:complete